MYARIEKLSERHAGYRPVCFTCLSECMQWEKVTFERAGSVDSCADCVLRQGGGVR